MALDTNAFLKEGYAPTTTKSYFSAFRTRRREYEDAMQYMSSQSQEHDEPRNAKRPDMARRAGPSAGTAPVLDIPLRLSSGMGKLSIPQPLTEDDVDRIHDIALHFTE